MGREEVADADGEVRLDVDALMRELVPRRVRALIALAGLANALAAVFHLAVLVYPQIFVKGFIEGYVSLTGYRIANILNGYAVYMPNIEAVRIVSLATVAHLLALLAMSMASIVLGHRKRFVTASALAYGVSLSLIILSGVMRYLAQAFSADVSRVFAMARDGNNIRISTSAGTLEYPGIEVLKTMAYRAMFDVPYTLLLSLTVAVILSVAAIVWVVYLLFIRKNVEPSTTPDEKLPLRVKRFEKAFKTQAPTSLALILVFIAVNAGVITYSPVQLSLTPVAPPVTLSPINVTGVQASPGWNCTSITVNITFPSQQSIDLLNNSDFGLNLDGWLYGTNNTQYAWWWVPSITAESVTLTGLAVIGANYTNADARGWIAQNFTLPASATLNVTYSIYLYASGPPGLIDKINITAIFTISSCTHPVQLNINSNNVGNFPCSLPSPGTYTANLTVQFDVKNVGRYVTVRAYIDYFNVTATLPKPFSEDVTMVINYDTEPYYARLILAGYSNIAYLTANITVHYLTYAGQPIVISAGSPVSIYTDWALIPANSAGGINFSGYYSTSGVTGNLRLYLQLCRLPGGEGACVYYPIEFVLISP